MGHSRIIFLSTPGWLYQEVWDWLLGPGFWAKVFVRYSVNPDHPDWMCWSLGNFPISFARSHYVLGSAEPKIAPRT